MNLHSQGFQQAIKDYIVFLQKKYPQKTVLKLVGDRYKLSANERAMLYRGASPIDIASRRKTKLTDESTLHGETLYVDALNQLLTIGSYLLGKPVFVSLDGYLRDAFEMHGKDLEKFLPLRALENILSYLIKTEVGVVKLYFDSKVNGFEIFYDKLRKALPDFILQPVIIISDHVDNDLAEISEGILSTSDSVIIDKTSLPVFDLSRATIEYHYFPKFFDLNTIATDSQI